MSAAAPSMFFLFGAPSSPSSQLQTELDSIGTTVQTGDTYQTYAQPARALNAYRQAAMAFQALTPQGNSSGALAGEVLAITSPTADNLTKARALLVQLFQVYEQSLPIPSTGPALATTPPATPTPATPTLPNVTTTTAAPSSGGAALVVGLLAVVAGGIALVVTRGRF